MATSVSKHMVTRLIKDIKQVMEYTAEFPSIMYKHDDTNMLLGYAFIVGPHSTPYQYGNYFFQFSFPPNYPFSPPTVRYLTNDGLTRFHPNFYKNGVCCLSILNTWKGPQWTSCQTILSVLLTISSLFQNDPLLLEPGIKETNPEISKFNDIIYYQNLNFCVYKIMNFVLKNDYNSYSSLDCVLDRFRDELKHHFFINLSTILSIIQEKATSDSNRAFVSTSIYCMRAFTNYDTLHTHMTKLVTQAND